ncbi:hypothetical protein NEHOM01_1115 [Nematocida homosporus]|uniref:uncharacterized protein n=1 Tax=Nematocida homosporus TaxID=1912981 RepID=UPI00221F07E0|nr:uncharacterized protein NEHOM01_1115 [Nematocida homosporus]KAI5185865.1 hypothetical protein NEHOM01_1115 [Nematocida homosporus]
MRDRTKEYLAGYGMARQMEYRRRQEVLERLVTYQGQNGRVGELGYGVGELLYVTLANYWEVRVCTYQYSIGCMECRREVYVCGVNCKTCGKWVCTQCIGPVEGVALCRGCSELVRVRMEVSGGREWIGRNVQVQYAMLQECVQRPSQERLQELVREVQVLEKDLVGSGVDVIIRRNIIVRMKQVLCDWYLVRAQEEKCAALIEQLEYLRVLKESNPQLTEVLDRSIEEVLLEIASNNHVSGSNA